ncbi:MAG TPA: DUF4190 domain-containing protein [Candidatus Limnocylindrales bacterium]|nr:DUF4190 domain-containing protein [Candidatus Limnocylindrales bacterium]
MTSSGPDPTATWNREPRTSAAAVASLIFGIFSVLGGCLICAIPPIVAVITGHVGIARTRQGRLKGHGMALTGIIIGYLLIIPGLIGLFFFSRTDVGKTVLSSVIDLMNGVVDFVRNLLP